MKMEIGFNWVIFLVLSIFRLEISCYFIYSVKISVWMLFRRYYVNYAIVWVHRPHRHHHPWKWHTKWHHSTVQHLKMKRKRWHSEKNRNDTLATNKSSQFSDNPSWNLVSFYCFSAIKITTASKEIENFFLN